MFNRLATSFLICTITFSSSTISASDCLNDLSQHHKANTLSLRDCSLVDSDIFFIKNYITAHSDIHNLDLSHNKLTSEAAKELVNLRIDEINLKGNNLSDEGAKLLASNIFLKTLSLSKNNIKGSGAIALAHNNSLQNLDLSYNKLPNGVTKEFAQNTSIKRLNLYNAAYFWKFGEASLLAANRHLIYLNVGANEIWYYEIINFAENTTLKGLDVSRNNVGTLGLQALTNNHTLTYLNISDNLFYDNELTFITQFTNLKHLAVSQNCFSKKGLAQLENMHLAKLEVLDNNNPKHCEDVDD